MVSGWDELDLEPEAGEVNLQTVKTFFFKTSSFLRS